MAKAPDLSPRALSLVDALLARLPASVPDLETWWERQGKVTRLELRRILRQLDGERLTYDRDTKEVKPRHVVTARAGRGGVRAGDLVVASPAAKSPHLFTVTEPEPLDLRTEREREPAGPDSFGGSDYPDDLPAPLPATSWAKPSPVSLSVSKAPASSTVPQSVVDATTVAVGRPFEPPPVVANVGGVTFTGSAAAVKEAAKAYQRALLSQPTPRPPTRRGPAPLASSVSERVRASVCRKPGTVGEVIARFPDENENTIRGALGTLKARGTVSHTGGKYGAPRG